MTRRDVADARDDAFRELYVRNYPFILRYVRRRLDARNASDLDVVSETFAVAWRRLDDVPLVPDDLPWLYGVARNVLLHQQRRGRQLQRLQTRLDAQPAASHEAPSIDAETRAFVRYAIDALSEVDREIVKLSFWEAMTHAQIASALRLSENAVELRLRRARARLRDTLSIAPFGDTRHASLPVSPTNEKSGDA